MKTKSRFLALLLALILLLAVPCAVADEAAVVREEVGTAEDYVNLLRSVEKPYYPETVVFTDAGPFLPAVNVGSKMLRAARVNDGASSDDGLVLNKTAEKTEDGEYKIRLEAYTTGKVTTTTRTTPVDIVLVLDQSTSMRYDFSGKDISDNEGTNSNSRQYAMKTAVKAFIDNVAEKYNEKDSDHRISIVKYGNEAEIVSDWTVVDPNGQNALKGSVSNLSIQTNTGTQVQTGLIKANELIKTKYDGKNTDRQRVVILFTDGVPGQSGFDTGVADEAIAAAKTLKDSGVTVYTIGIFNGADPGQLFGEKWDYVLWCNEDIPCTGEVGSYWGGSWASSVFGNNDFDALDVPAGNRFLNYLSTNYGDATEIGLERGNYNPGGHTAAGGTGYKITKNFGRTTNKNYYLTANDKDSLEGIFQNISQQIETPTIELGSETVIKDIIADSFELPKGTTVDAITVSTADATANAFSDPNAKGSWGKEQDAGLTPVIDGNKISVTGFDFNANFVTDKQKTDGSYGKKLIIEFTVRVKDGFLGGNDVPTNGADSGVYTKDGTSVKKFDVPTVNVPIPDVTVSADDKNVYLLGEVTPDQLKTGATVTVGNTELKLREENYGLADWQKEYVDIDVKITDKAGNEVSDDGLKDLVDDTTYTIQVTVSPKPENDGKESSGTPAAKQEKSGVGNINVYKPEVTFKDSEINLGDKADYNTQNHGTPFEVWKHGETFDSSVTMIDRAPELTYTYDPEAGTFTKDQPVKVTEAKIGGKDIIGHVTFYREKCAYPGCDNGTAKVKVGKDGVNFIVHVKSFDLKIVKTGWDEVDENQSFLFTVSGDGNTLEVVIHGSKNGKNSVTIKGLKPGENYTVTEIANWSWRYTPTGGNSRTVNTTTWPAENGVVTVTFNNNREETKWLDGNAYCDNKWIDGSTDKAPSGN